MKVKNGVYNIIYSVLSQIITISLGLMIPRLFITTYGSEMNGLLNSLNQIFIYIGLVEAGIGIATVQALYQPISLNAKQEINQILAATNHYYRQAGLLYLLVVLLLSFIYPLIIDINENYFVIVGIIIFSGLGNVINFIFQGKYKLLLQAEGKNYIVTKIQTFIFILTSFAKITCIFMGYNVLVVQIVFFFVNLLQIIFIYLYIKQNYKWLNLKVEPNYQAVSQKKAVFIHQIAGLIFQNTDVLVLTVVSGLKVVSVYSIYKLVVGMISSTLLNIGNSVSYMLGQTYSSNLQKYKRLIDVYDVYYSAIGFALFTITLILILPFMKLYTAGVTDTNYIDDLLPILFVTVEILIIGRNAMLNTINVAGHFDKTQKQAIIETIINLSISVAGAFLFGIYGVLIGTIVALLYRTNDIIFYANKNILRRSVYKSYRIFASNLMLMGFILFFIGKIKFSINGYLSFVIFAVLLSICVIPTFLICASIFNKNEFNEIKKFIDSKIINYRRR